MHSGSNKLAIPRTRFYCEYMNLTERRRINIFILGSETEYNKISKWFEEKRPKNAQLLSAILNRKCDKVVRSCDVGLIFLDPRFTIPNYPSRLLSYMEYKMPVLIATDANTDISSIAEANGYGFWCVNGDLETFNSLVNKLRRPFFKGSNRR